MKYLPVLSLACLLCFASSIHAATDYQSITADGIIVTGIRSDSDSTDSVVITASYTSAGITYATLYNGSLAAAAAAPPSSWNPLTPVFAGQTVTSSTFYGPNTRLFDSTIPVGQIVAVGSYKYTEGASGAGFDHGMLYEGTVAGTGTWTQLDATSLVGSSTLLNTIAHSTMGDLVVGNYDTSLAAGNAFIYHKSTNVWTTLNPTGSASVTAYGIWQNSANSYTIAGGVSDLNDAGLDLGYLVNYDSDTGVLSDYKTFNYNNQPLSSLISHFDGITLTEGGFHLTGDYLTTAGGLGAFFAAVPINLDGSFGEAQWTDIAFPGALGTSGNTIVENSVLGIYVTDGGTFSYIATVPEPTAMSLALLAVGFVLLGGRSSAAKARVLRCVS